MGVDTQDKNIITKMIEMTHSSLNPFTVSDHYYMCMCVCISHKNEMLSRTDTMR